MPINFPDACGANDIILTENLHRTFKEQLLLMKNIARKLISMMNAKTFQRADWTPTIALDSLRTTGAFVINTCKLSLAMKTI